MRGCVQGAGVAPWSMDLPDFDDDGEPFAHFRQAGELFLPISRRYWVPGFLAHNLTAVAREILCIGPVAFFAYWRLTHVAGKRM